MINDVYYRHGIYVEIFYMDREFEKLRRRILGRSTLNTTAESDHFP